ncbi:hypothetical protein M422DRAFT_212249 [Sphaerobolus stellatus SS14]|uniref:protein-tyrosine-phosphatase n=1 Tax=Sphaerobolus stellatus (strain SS14) TaxID=990650 RepID=A0A0C9V3I6_SPHS4|nr:hypothetical protein M422DRAFT_212249 [Sphaerobolus stellatus SS14]
MSAYNQMDMVIENLWIGTHIAALNAELLQKHGIKSILTVMRGKLAISKPFSRHQILLDDTDDADALAHFPACNQWIDAEIKKGRGVLVHCQAGMSRSATIVAAYLMHKQRIDVQTAVEMIRKVRPSIQPNPGFMAQLEVFYSAHYQLTRRNKETRTFYVQRAVKEVLNGDGSSLQMDMFAKYPRTPGDSVPSTPHPQRRRRIRCKMCRQELATREHMVDHGQIGPATPTTGNILTPATSRRPSASAGDTIVISARDSTTGEQSSATLIRRPSTSSVDGVRRPSFGGGLSAMTPINTDAPQANDNSSTPEHRPSSSDGVPRKKSFGANPFGGLSMTPVSNGPANSLGSQSTKRPRRGSLLGLGDGAIMDHTVDDIASMSVSALESDDEDDAPHSFSVTQTTTTSTSTTTTTSTTKSSTVTSTSSTAPTSAPSSGLHSPQELASQIHPALAALRSSQLMSALKSSNSLGRIPMKEQSGDAVQRKMSANTISPPILLNATCSGYFVEPMKWMEPFLEAGNMAGKITCPNKKCGAKLGSYDWAGVQCSCKEWVIPGFCIHRSKVDEVVV